MQYIPPTLPIANISVANTTHDLVDRVQTIVDYLNENPIESSANDLNSNTAHFLVGNTVTTNTTALALGNAALYANGSPGTNGQVLVSNGSATYWTTPDVGDEHALLSNTHSDTNAAAVVRGDLIAGVGASPLWTRLAIGPAGYALTSNGTDPAWTASVNSANFANTANTAGTANNATHAFGKNENALNVNSAISALAANNTTYAFGKLEGALNVNSALGANNASYLGGYASSVFVRPLTGSPANGQVLTWNAAGSTWFPQSLSGGSLHAILSSTHTDANVATAKNGDLIMASGGSGGSLGNNYSLTYTWIWNVDTESWANLTYFANDTCVSIANANITGSSSGTANVSYQWTWPGAAANGWSGSGALPATITNGALEFAAGPFGIAGDTISIDGMGQVTFTWETLGVPPGANVTAVGITFNRKRIISIALDYPQFDFYLVNGANTNILASNGVIASYGWTINATDGSFIPETGSTINVLSSYEVSNTSITFKIFSAVSSHVNRTDAQIDILFANIALTVYYTSATGNSSGTYTLTALSPSLAWVDLGVPNNAIVDSVQIAGLQSKVGSANDIIQNSLTIGIIPAGITNGSVLDGTSNLASYALSNAAGSFTNLASSNTANVSGIYSDSATSIQVIMNFDIVSGSAEGGVILDEFKNLALLINYTIPDTNTTAATWGRLPIGSNGQVLTSNGTFAGWATLDVSALTANDSAYLGGFAANTFLRPFVGTPSNGQTILWSAANNYWYPVNPSGGSEITTNTLANIPDANTDGNLFLPSDGYLFYRANGTAWQAWGPVVKMTPPPPSNTFTWVNQGIATVTDNPGGSLTLTFANNSTDNLHLLVKPVPNTPYTITTYMSSLTTYRNNYQGWGLCWYNSTSGKIQVFYMDPGSASGQLGVGWNNYTDATSYSGSVTANGITVMVGAWPFLGLRIADDGTHRQAWVTIDGQTWISTNYQLSNNFITPTHVGWWGFSTMAAAVVHRITLLSWEVT